MLCCSKNNRFPVCGSSQISSSTNQLQVTHNEANKERERKKKKKRGEKQQEKNVLTHARTDRVDFGALRRGAGQNWDFYTSEKHLLSFVFD